VATLFLLPAKTPARGTEGFAILTPMMANRTSVLAITFLASACAVDRTAATSSAIIGGATSGPDEFPATGMLVAGRGLECTATLIAPDVALTAAHCLQRPVYGDFAFSLDPDASDGTDDLIPVKLFHQHPDFDEGVDGFVDLAVRNDIAVIILERPIPGVQPELFDTPALGTEVGSGSQFAMCGYGTDLWYTEGYAQKRDAPMVVDRTEDFEFSTMPADPQPCNGDSGAPLFADTPEGRRLVGVVSRAMGRSQMCDTGAIITRVAPYAAWITEASMDRETGGCHAGGGGGSALPLGVLWALHARRRRRSPR
jgi:uncharacterized protein (TIGR03382 family)